MRIVIIFKDNRIEQLTDRVGEGIFPHFDHEDRVLTFIDEDNLVDNREYSIDKIQKIEWWNN